MHSYGDSVYYVSNGHAYPALVVASHAVGTQEQIDLVYLDPSKASLAMQGNSTSLVAQAMSVKPMTTGAAYGWFSEEDQLHQMLTQALGQVQDLQNAAAAAKAAVAPAVVAEAVPVFPIRPDPIVPKPLPIRDQVSVAGHIGPAAAPVFKSGTGSAPIGADGKPILVEGGPGIPFDAAKIEDANAAFLANKITANLKK